MDKNRILIEKPTAQVRIMSEEFMADGKIHSRKQIVDYVQQQGKMLGLPPFRESHLAGGIREATTNLQCEKLGRGTFRAVFSEKGSELSCWDRAASICDKAIEQLTDVCRDIDYVNANDKELELLATARDCVKKLHDYKDNFKSYKGDSDK